MSSLYDELFPHFSSTFAHVGLDETIDVGEGRSQALCREHGMSEIYLGYLRQTREACRRHGRTMMFWADMIQGMDRECRPAYARYKKDVAAVAGERGGIVMTLQCVGTRNLLHPILHCYMYHPPSFTCFRA